MPDFEKGAHVNAGWVEGAPGSSLACFYGVEKIGTLGATRERATSRSSSAEFFEARCSREVSTW
jgi:hypothetical protein